MEPENKDLFGEEEVVLGHLQDVGRLDRERELYRLVNTMNDTLVKYSGLEPEEIEETYTELKHRLQIEYYMTKFSDLEPDQMYVWHLSVFSILDKFQSMVKSKPLKNKTNIVNEFDRIFSEDFSEYLSELSERNEISNVGEMLQQPQEIRVEEQSVFYWQIYKSQVYSEIEQIDGSTEFDEDGVSVEMGGPIEVTI